MTAELRPIERPEDPPAFYAWSGDLAEVFDCNTGGVIIRSIVDGITVTVYSAPRKC
jgi:hypothetical protein